MKKGNVSGPWLNFKDIESFFNLNKIKQIYNIPENIGFQDIAVVFKYAKFRRYKTKSFIIEKGEKNPNMYFILKGLVRSYTINDKGDEITASLHRENQFFFSTSGMLLQEASQFYFECLESTYVGFMDFKKIEEILPQYQKLEETRSIITQRVFRQNYERINSFVLLSPEERYVDFIKQNPDLNERVPNKYIANVLGITPVSLSRIRKRLAEKKK